MFSVLNSPLIQGPTASASALTVTGIRLGLASGSEPPPGLGKATSALDNESERMVQESRCTNGAWNTKSGVQRG